MVLSIMPIRRRQDAVVELGQIFLRPSSGEASSVWRSNDIANGRAVASIEHEACLRTQDAIWMAEKKRGVCPSRFMLQAGITSGAVDLIER